MLPASPYVATKSRSKALVSLGASILAAARQDNAAHGKVNVQLLRVALFFIDSVKVCLDLVFSAAATRLPISSNELEYADPEQFDESFNDKFAQLMDELQIKDNAMAPQVTLTGTSSSEVGENFCKLMGSLDLTEDESLFLQGNAKPPPQLTEEEIAQILSDLTLNEGRSSTVQANPATMVWNEEDGEWQLSTAVYQELVAFFAGQDDVHVPLDGAIHFNPKWATEENESNGKLTTTVLNDDGDEMGDITLVENSPPKLDDDMSVDLTVVEGPSYSKVQPMYVDLTAEDFPRRGKQKLASLPPDHEMFVDLTWPSIGAELPGSGTFEDPYELIDTA
ncbi:MAG: hypothetical protein NXY57DRAFT_967231 [Lentinula lateritia]|nr:MAG: hypothetical protein NXY57DRAFT_967231 [Lentinula lateritia]